MLPRTLIGSEIIEDSPSDFSSEAIFLYPAFLIADKTFLRSSLSLIPSPINCKSVNWERAAGVLYDL